MLVLRDAKGNTVCRLRAVKAILSSWSPVLRNALELSASPSAGEQRDMHLNSGATHSTHSTHTALIHSNSSGCLASYVHGAGSGGSNCGPQASAAAAGLGCGSSGGFITNTGTSSGAAGAERGHAGEVAGDFGGGASSAAVGSGCVLATHGGLVELPVLVSICTEHNATENVQWPTVEKTKGQLQHADALLSCAYRPGFCLRTYNKNYNNSNTRTGVLLGDELACCAVGALLLTCVCRLTSTRRPKAWRLTAAALLTAVRHGCAFGSLLRVSVDNLKRSEAWRAPLLLPLLRLLRCWLTSVPLAYCCCVCRLTTTRRLRPGRWRCA